MVVHLARPHQGKSKHQGVGRQPYTGSTKFPRIAEKNIGPATTTTKTTSTSSHLVSCPIRLSCLRWISTNLFPLPPFLENNPPFFNNKPHSPRLTNTRPLCRGDLAKYIPRRWAPTSYKWSHNPYKWPYKGITGVATAISGVIILLITGRGPPCKICHELIFRKLTYPTFGKETSFSKSAGWYRGYVRSLKGHNFPNTIAQALGYSMGVNTSWNTFPTSLRSLKKKVRVKGKAWIYPLRK